MENASKALLIAGVIFIVLATISIVMFMYNNSRDFTDNATQRIDDVIIKTHNIQFTIYEKNNLSYSELLKLINSVLNNNKRANGSIYIVKIEMHDFETSTSARKIYTNKDVLEDPNIFKTSTQKGEEFKIFMGYSNNGLINVIKIYKIK